MFDAYLDIETTGLSYQYADITVIGIPMVFVSLHFMNNAAMAFGGMTRVMLGKLQ